MDALLKDLKHSVRMFLQTPGFTAAALAALALGIAANTAIFSLVDTVLLKSFAYPDPDRIVMFQNIFSAGRSGSAAPTEFNWWRQVQAFQDVSAYDFNVANWTSESVSQQIPIMHASAGFFTLCGGPARLGRTFTPADDLPHAPMTVILAYGFWQRSFGGDPQIIGKRMTLNGIRYEIIGVAGANLQHGQIAEQSLLSGDLEISQPPDVYLPFQIDPESASHGHGFNVAARLRPGVTLAAANAELQASYQQFVHKWPGIDSPDRGFGIRSLKDAIAGGVRTSLLILSCAVGLVLLIACANVANLLVARATGRRREIAVRVAVGAGRGRIVRQLLTESMLLSLAGGALGLAAGYAGIHALLRLIPAGIPRIGAGGSNVDLDWRVVAFTTGLSILSCVLFGLVPALDSSRADLSTMLKEGNRSGAGVRSRQTRAWLVAVEMALAVLLLIGAGLLVRSFIAIHHVNPGFEADHVLTMRISLAGPQFEKQDSVSRVIHEAVRRIRALPGVEVASTTCCVPLADRLHGAFQIAGRPPGSASGGLTGWTLVSPGYFETFRIPVVRGRSFSERDENGPPVVIINQALARQFWQARDPLQDQLVIGNQPPRRIVGIVGDVRDEALTREPRPNVYVLSTDGGGISQVQPWAWAVRTRVPPLSLSAALQKELREASGGLPVSQVRTMEETVARSQATGNFNTLVLTIFACSALFLAAVGIYGLMAYSVAQRVPEIGIRLALGAQSAHIRKMMLTQALQPILAGLALGLVNAVALARGLSGLLFGVKPWDPVVFCVVPLILAAVGVAAIWFPVLRAGRVDPIHALRQE